MKELALLAHLFLRLGLTGFGGPAAHIAMMEEEVVRRRGWLTREKFLDLVGATNLIPGPNSTELAIHIGMQRAGWPGFAVAGTCFILPAVLATGVLAWAYVRWGTAPPGQAILYGVKPVMIAIVADALLRLVRAALKTRVLTAIAVLALAALLLGTHELAVLGAAGFLAIAFSGSKGGRLSIIPFTLLASAPLAPASLLTLFLTFLKIGAILFGSGYVLLAYLRADFVQRLGWLTEAQLLDAVAAGQITPGPVFSTATFVGYLLGGPAGAALATLGIFLPAFVFVALSGPLIPRIRRSPVASAFLDGVNVASVSLMAAVAWTLGRAAIVDPTTTVIGIGSLLLVSTRRVNSSWLVLGGGILGLLLLPLTGTR